jgi:hypothetical protein
MDVASRRPCGPNEGVEAALRAGASHARVELLRTVTSTEVLRVTPTRPATSVSASLVAAREARSSAVAGWRCSWVMRCLLQLLE